MKQPRPNTVKLAMCFLLVSRTIASGRTISGLSWPEVFTDVVAIISQLIAWFFVIMVVCGASWARWVLVVLISGSIVTLLLDQRSLTGWFVLDLILNLTAVGLLFTDSSSDWFQHYRKPAYLKKGGS
jgi:hypothetical protein